MARRKEGEEQAKDGRARMVGMLKWLVVPAVLVFLWFLAVPQYADYAARAKPVYYNGILAPQFSRASARPNVPVLRAGVPTTLRFGMGPRWTASDIPPVQVDPLITNSSVDVPLTVLLACSFCDAPRALQGKLVYAARRYESNVIALSFVPSASALGDGRLEVSVFDDRNGAEYDRIVVDVTVSGAQGLEPVEGTLALPPTTPRAGAATGPVADVIMDVAADTTGDGVVTVKVTPIDPALQTALAPLAKDGAGRWRTFKTGVVDQKDIERVTTRAYGELTALVMQGDFLRWLSRFREAVVLPKQPKNEQTAQQAVDVVREAQEALVFSDQQQVDVARLFGKYGQNLYAALFEDGVDGASLAPVIAELERASHKAPAERPLRLLIRTARVSLPWQYLHPASVRAIDANNFWRMRFSLAVQRVNTGKRERAPTSSDGRTVLYLKYATATDVTNRYADLQIGQLTALAKSPVIIESGKALLAALTDRRKEIGAVISFLHASSGRELEAIGDSVKTSERPAGPEIEFSPGDAVDSGTLEWLSSSLSREDRPVLAAGPLVFLNACETGPSTVAIPHVKLEDAMFQLGARGVIVTEIAVWVPFGHEFGSRLFDRLGKGQPVSDAVTLVRRDMLAARKNPFGLLYSYYGDPALQLQRP